MDIRYHVGGSVHQRPQETAQPVIGPKHTGIQQPTAARVQREETGRYKEVNIDLDRYTRAFDVIDVMYQSLRTVLNVKNTYSSVSDRIGDYKTMLEAFHEKILKHGNIEPSDALILTINEKAIRDIANEGEHLYKS